MFATLLVPAALGLASVRCGHDCELPPCVVRFAIRVDVTAQGSGGPVSGAFVIVSGAATGTVPCTPDAGASTCHIGGTAGTYTLEIGAPGFERTQRTVSVRDTSGPCECEHLETQLLYVVLLPSP
jgi:hypothetical protein